MPAAQVALATITLGSAASSVTFGSIPATYRDLRLVITGSGTGGGVEVSAVLNSDTGANYSLVRIRGNGSSASSASVASKNFILLGDVDAALSNYTADFMDYSATDKHKTVISRYNNSTNVVDASATRWASTSAITSIAISGTSGNWTAGSTFSLYGIVS